MASKAYSAGTSYQAEVCPHCGATTEPPARTINSRTGPRRAAIRHLGNFGAHPEEFQNTGELVAVEDDEVAWTVDLLDSLF